MGPCLVALALAAAPVSQGGLAEARALEEAGKDLQALAVLDGVVRAQPAWSLPRLEAARLRLKLGQELDLAEHDLDVARALAPENARGQYLWGLVREERGDDEGALRAYEVALLYRPGYDDARFRLAGLYFSRGDWARAEEAYRTLVARRPDWTQARLQWAATLERQGRWEDVERELEHLWSKERSKTAGRKLAELYERTGREKEAKRIRDRLEPRSRKKKMRPLRKSRR